MVARHRRLISAALLGVAVAAGLSALRPATGPLRPLVVATTDLPAGHRLVAEDLRISDWPADLHPGGASSAPAALLGRVLAAPLRRGEPLTDTRVVGPGLATALDPGCRVLAVPLSYPPPEGMLRAGDLVDLLAGAPVGTPAGAPATLLAEAALVLAISDAGTDPPGSLLTGGRSGEQVVVAVDGRQATAVAGALGTRSVGVALRPPSASPSSGSRCSREDSW